MTPSQTRYTRIALITFFLPLFLCFVSTVFRAPAPSHLFTHQERFLATLSPAANTLRCTIYMPNNSGSRVGLHYELFRLYCRTHGYTPEYVSKPLSDTTEIWEYALQGHTDLLAINIIRDSMPRSAAGKLAVSAPITGMGDVWVTHRQKSESDANGGLLSWIDSLRHTPTFSRMLGRFSPHSVNRCPYDSLLKAYAPQLGWDYRVLRAIMYSESQYRMNAISRRGAIGLMQIKASTAQELHRDSIAAHTLFDPETNIRYATLYFKYLRNNMNVDHLPNDQQINFVLAAYNAGMGRTQLGRDSTKMAGGNPDNWEEVQAFMPKETQQYVWAVQRQVALWQ